MFSGFVSSFKNALGWDLQVESGGQSEDEIKNNNTEERQSLFKQLSGFMGKDITSMISLPVWIFEPHSFLQIICEPLQFEALLQQASTHPDSAMRMAYLAAFAIAGYNCAIRTKKPFNPLLGETYEFLGPDGKYKYFAEQVSHHPPIGVAEVTSENYWLQFEMALKTKFSGNSTDVTVSGINQFKTTKFNDYFTWNHLDTCAHNVIIGGMWVDHFGTLEIKNHTTGEKCIVKVTKAGWLGSGRYDTNGQVFNKDGDSVLKINGKWNDYLDATKAEESAIRLWKKVPNSAHKWNWNKFNEDMNYMDSEYEAILPETDSRLRGDRLALEKGNMELAGKEKHRLEEEQRAKRKDRETKGDEYKPQYFESKPDEEHGHLWVRTGDYWVDRENRIKEKKEQKN